MKRLSKTQVKIDWLLANQRLWEGLKLPEEQHRLTNVAELMQEQGLYSKTTNVSDIRISLVNLIRTARIIRRQKLKGSVVKV